MQKVGKVAVGAVSKVESMKRILRDAIMDGTFAPNHGIPSQNRLATEYGISHNTVREALSALVHEGLLFRIQGKGTFVAERKPVRTNAIGITLCLSGPKTFLNDPYHVGVAKGLERVLSREGKTLTFRQTTDRFANTFAPGEVDGVVVLAPRIPYKDQLLDFARLHVPALAVGAEFEEAAINSVCSDHEGDSFRGVAHLLAAGRRRIAFVAPRGDKPTAVYRWRGYRRALAEYGVGYDERLVHVGQGSVEDLADALSRLLDMKPDAVFSTRTGITKMAVEQIQARSLGIPEDIAVLTYDDFDNEVAAFGVPYTVIKQPLEAIGQRAAEVLLDWIAGARTAPVKIRLESSLIRRNET